MRLLIIMSTLVLGNSIVMAAEPNKPNDDIQPIVLTDAQLDNIDAGRRNRNRNRNRTQNTSVSAAESAFTTPTTLSIAKGSSSAQGYQGTFSDSMTYTFGTSLLTGSFQYSSGGSLSRSIACTGC